MVEFIVKKSLCRSKMSVWQKGCFSLRRRVMESDLSALNIKKEELEKGLLIIEDAIEKVINGNSLMGYLKGIN